MCCEFTSGGQEAQHITEEDSGEEGKAGEEEGCDEQDGDEQDGDDGCTVSEVSIAVLRAKTAKTANEALHPIHIEYELEFESEDDSVYRPCVSRPHPILAKLNPMLRQSLRRRTRGYGAC